MTYTDIRSNQDTQNQCKRTQTTQRVSSNLHLFDFVTDNTVSQGVLSPIASSAWPCMAPHRQTTTSPQASRDLAGKTAICVLYSHDGAHDATSPCHAAGGISIDIDCSLDHLLAMLPSGTRTYAKGKLCRMRSK